MRLHTPAFKLVPLLAIAVLSASAATAQQTEKRVRGVISGQGFSRIKIAVPQPPSRDGSSEIAFEIVTALRDDLEFSGYFDVIDPTLYSLVPASTDGRPRHDDWISIGADALVELQATSSAGSVDLQARLFDNPSRSVLLSKRYGGKSDLVRRVVHRLADDLVHHYTGRDGVAMTRIAFVSNHGEGKEIYLMDYDGRRIRRLTTTGTLNLSPVWSPGGDELAFMSWRGKQPGVYVISSAGALSNLPIVHAELSSAPDWSPDGGRLIYSSDPHGNSELYVLDRSTGRNTRLTRNPAIETAPAYSPNGREIAFTSDRTGAPQIYIMDAEGLSARRISWTGNYNDSANWSPNGDRLAYASRIDGFFEIVVLDLATDTATRLTWGEGNNENPSWSPDGRHLVFASNRAGSYDIYTIRADGGELRRLTRGGNAYTPDWSQ